MDEKGFTTFPEDEKHFRNHCILDEISPYFSIVSVGYQDKYLGTFLLQPSDFGVRLNPEDIKIKNTEEAIHQANILALRGENQPLTDYLAMNAAPGVFMRRYMLRPDAFDCDIMKINPYYLQASFQGCKQTIISGGAWEKLQGYVRASGGSFST